MEKSIAYIAAFAALIAALGAIPALPLAWTFGVPITAQTLGIMLCGTLLGPRRGALAVLLFLALVALGLPLLAGGRGGVGVFFGPTVGFLVGWLLAVFIVGVTFKQLLGRCSVFWAAFLASIVGGIVVLYIPGIIGLSLYTGQDLATTALPMLSFVVGDLIKAVLAGWITQTIFRIRPFGLSKT